MAAVSIATNLFSPNFLLSVFITKWYFWLLLFTFFLLLKKMSRRCWTPLIQNEKLYQFIRLLSKCLLQIQNIYQTTKPKIYLPVSGLPYGWCHLLLYAAVFANDLGYFLVSSAGWSEPGAPPVVDSTIISQITIYLDMNII